ncbi:unnamed protein product [Prorocentrum cordatum]|uniref:Galectin n=1 Tax=Prorocentrum cordatum TaxID=2364126 RepID=A0ABN9XQ78_9DINO|nr:unnamed protein product [Polarella glacialis]
MVQLPADGSLEPRSGGRILWGTGGLIVTLLAVGRLLWSASETTRAEFNPLLAPRPLSSAESLGDALSPSPTSSTESGGESSSRARAPSSRGSAEASGGSVNSAAAPPAPARPPTAHPTTRKLPTPQPPPIYAPAPARLLPPQTPPTYAPPEEHPTLQPPPTSVPTRMPSTTEPPHASALIRTPLTPQPTFLFGDMWTPPVAQPTPPPTQAPTLNCINTNFGATAQFLLDGMTVAVSCEDVGIALNMCEHAAHYDDSDFSFLDMCCACGGGSTAKDFVTYQDGDEFSIVLLSSAASLANGNEAWHVDFESRNGDILFRMAVTPSSGEVVTNSRIDGVWGDEDKDNAFPFDGPLYFFRMPPAILMFGTTE